MEDGKDVTSEVYKEPCRDFRSPQVKDTTLSKNVHGCNLTGNHSF